MTQPAHVQPRGYKVSSRSYADIEHQMALVRRCLAPDSMPGDALDGLTIFESLGRFAVSVDGVEIRLAYRVCEDKPFVEGETRFDAPHSEIEVSLTNSSYKALAERSKGMHRAKFCLGHELSHAVLHTRLVCQLGGMSPDDARTLRRETPHPPYEDSEWQANAGAAAFWMPADALDDMRARGWLSVWMVARRFNVSYEAARNRLNVFALKAGELVPAALAAREVCPLCSVM